MGIYVDLFKYDYAALCNEIVRVGEIERSFKNIKKLELILSKFGEIIGGKYIILNNEHSEDGNPYWNVAKAIETVFGVNEENGHYMFDAFCNTRSNQPYSSQDMITWAYANSVLEDIKDELQKIDNTEGPQR